MAGFDVLEQPLEVKKRIGDLPETPPIYPVEMSRFFSRRRSSERFPLDRTTS